MRQSFDDGCSYLVIMSTGPKNSLIMAMETHLILILMIIYKVFAQQITRYFIPAK